LRLPHDPLLATAFANGRVVVGYKVAAFRVAEGLMPSRGRQGSERGAAFTERGAAFTKPSAQMPNELSPVTRPWVEAISGSNAYPTLNDGSATVPPTIRRDYQRMWQIAYPIWKAGTSTAFSRCAILHPFCPRTQMHDKRNFLLANACGPRQCDCRTAALPSGPPTKRAE
jgi:hypothetical protein